MNKFRNVVLLREYKDLLSIILNIEPGYLGGYSLDIEIKDSICNENFIYQGKNAEADRDHDFNLLVELLKELQINLVD